jgi:hypothetical protein
MYSKICTICTNKYYTIKKNSLFLLGAGKKVGLEVNREKTKYMFISHNQNVEGKTIIYTHS